MGKILKDALGDRMKMIERVETGRSFLPYIPVYARIDGRSFSKFTRGMDKPFDRHLSDVMLATTRKLIENSGALIGYTQSDEISLLWMSDDYQKDIFFGGKVQKMCSVLSGLATAAFIEALLKTPYADRVSKLPHFDARICQVPTRTEAANMFLWREKDASKNSVSMLAQTHFSHTELQGKSTEHMKMMLGARDVWYGQMPDEFKRGSFIRQRTIELPIDEASRMKIKVSKRPAAGSLIMRNTYERIAMPSFTTVSNREAVLFEGADPIPYPLDVTGASPSIDNSIIMIS